MSNDNEVHGVHDETGELTLISIDHRVGYGKSLWRWHRCTHKECGGTVTALFGPIYKNHVGASFTLQSVPCSKCCSTFQFQLTISEEAWAIVEGERLG